MRSLIPLRSRAPPRPCTIAGASPLRATPSSFCTASYLTSPHLNSRLVSVPSFLVDLPAPGRSSSPSFRSEFVVLITPTFLSKPCFLFVFYSIFPVGSSTDGPVNAVIYIHICHIYFTSPYHFTVKTLYLARPLTPDFLPQHCLQFVIPCRSVSNSSAPCPLLSRPICQSVIISVTAVALE